MLRQREGLFIHRGEAHGKAFHAGVEPTCAILPHGSENVGMNAQDRCRRMFGTKLLQRVVMLDEEADCPLWKMAPEAGSGWWGILLSIVSALICPRPT